MHIDKPGTHLDHLIRQTRYHHVQLSTMADKKANMILTIASLVIPLSIQHLTDPKLQPAAFVMVGACVMTVVVSAFAAMPKVVAHRKSASGGEPEGNPLFFGFFCTLDYRDYLRTMETILNDHNQAYEVQLREIYQMGVYLARRKYRYVRLAYGIFIVGVVSSALVYLVQTIVL